MRNLTCCYEYPPLGGGASHVVFGLTAELLKLGCTVDLVTMWFPGLRLRERRGGMTIYRIPCIRLDKKI